MERTRGGAYAKVRDPRDVPRLEGLVEGNRAVEGILHSAKRIISKSEARRSWHGACVSEGMGGEEERRRVRIRE